MDLSVMYVTYIFMLDSNEIFLSRYNVIILVDDN